MSRPSRRRWWLIPLGLLSALIVLIALAGPILRARTREAVEARCRAALGGACSIGALTLSTQGVHVRELRASPVQGVVRASIQSVDASFSWWDVLKGARRTPLSISIHGVVLGQDAPFADVLREVRRWREARERDRSGAERDARFALVRFELDDLSMSAEIAPLSRALLFGGQARWSEGAPARVRWSDASVSLGPVTAFQTGHCELEMPEDGGEGVVQCERFRARLDASTVAEQLRTLTGWMQLLQTLSARPVSASEPQRDAGATREPRPLPSRFDRWVRLARWRLRARDGVVEVHRGDREIVTFSHSTAEVQWNEGSITHAMARFSSAQRGPALDLRLERATSAPWVLVVRGADLPLAEVARWVRGVPWHDVERGSVHIDGRVAPISSGRYQASGSCTIRDFSLSHSKLSREPLTGLTVSLDGAAQIDLQERRLTAERLAVVVNDVRATVTGWAERAEDHTALAVTASLERSSCDAIRRSLPPSLTGPIAELTLGGQIAAYVSLALDTRRIDDTRLDVRVDDRCFIARDSYARGVSRFSGPFVQRVQEPDRVRAFVTGPGTAAWVPLGDIAPHMINAVLSREDGRFYRHAGVDPLEIRNAIVRNVSAGRFVYGGSTLSMQLAKNVFLAREKTLVRKLQELVLTWYLERSLGKDSILELYMNVVEFGPGIYGIGPASRFYFGVEPSQLTPLQAIFIATLLPNPVLRSAPFYRGALSPSTLAMLRAHARIMHHRGLLTDEELERASAESLVFRPRRGPVNGVLTLEVDASLEDSVAIARAMSIVVPAQRAPREPIVDDTGRALVQHSEEDERETMHDESTVPAPEPRSMLSDDPRFTRVNVHRPTVRIR